MIRGLSVLFCLAALVSTVAAQSTVALTGTTSTGEECTCEAPTTANVENSNNIIINRPDCDPTDIATCEANCAGIHSVDQHLADRCCLYVGQSASLLAFEEDSLWVPRIEEFNKCTGASVRLEYLPEGEDGMAAALRKDLGDDSSHEQGNAQGEGLFDAYIVQAPWLWPVVNGLENLSPRIKENAETVKFLDINPASRSAVSYNGTVRALPLDTDYIALGWRQDVFYKHQVPKELSPPRTIQDLALVAEQLHGLDFNEDGEGDWGICLTPQVNYFYAFVAPLMQTALRDPVTGIQTGQNMFFSADTFEPLIHQPAFKSAVETYWKIIRMSNCWEQLSKGEKCDRKTAFPTGRCAMVISMPGTLTKMLLDGAKYAPIPRINETSGQVEWDINNMTLGEGSYWGRRAPFPGSTLVQQWDAKAGYPLVSCTEDKRNCPLADDENGINYAPFFAEGGEAYALNGRQAKPAAREVMWDLFTWLSELPETELPLSGQYRKSHLTEENKERLMEGAGWPDQMVDDLFEVLGQYFKSEEDGGNPVQDLLMLGFPEYMDALDEELHLKFLGVSKDSTGGLLNREDPAKSIDPFLDRDSFDAAFNNFVRSLESRYSIISASFSGGRLGQLQRWRQSLNLPWRTDEELCVAALASDVEAFRQMQCASHVDFTSLCQTQSDLVKEFDEDLCSSMTSSSDSVNLAILIPSIVVPLVLLGILGGYFYGEMKRQKGDTLWQIKEVDLAFDNPPVVLGRGSFGTVLLASYRGTEVAVKRAIRRKAAIKEAPVEAALLPEMDASAKQRARAATQSISGNFRKKTNSKDTWLTKITAPGYHLESFEDEELGYLQQVMERWETKSSNSHSSFGSFGVYESPDMAFIREMRLLSQLRHPCIVTVMGAVMGAEPMLVMERCQHGSLYDVLQNDSVQLDGDVLLPILRDVCQGLRFLHASDPQIIHGDIKSHNVLIDSRFRAKIADFGLSAKRPSDGPTGTPYWMAPELIRGHKNRPATDVYSFGIVLYEVYSRKEPYADEDFTRVLDLVVDPNVNLRPPVPAECPPAIATTMKECWDADPNIRPTFEEIDLRLKRLGADKVAPQDSPSAAYAKKKQEGKAQRLLEDVFPAHVAEALREGRKVENEHHDCVTIFFSDIVGFTTLSAEIGPVKVADMLDRLYSQLDDLTTQLEIYKCETIGDAYMAITNLVKKQDDDHVKRMVDFSMAAIEASNKTLIDLEDPSKGTVQIRVGFHSGPVLSGVVGTRLPKYGVFGDTVNTASRMESNSLPLRIHCSEASAELLMRQAPEVPLTSRGVIKIKGKEMMSTFWVGDGGEEEEKEEVKNHTEC